MQDWRILKLMHMNVKSPDQAPAIQVIARMFSLLDALAAQHIRCR